VPRAGVFRALVDDPQFAERADLAPAQSAKADFVPS